MGAGESGVGAAILAQRKGFEVFVSDAGRIREPYIELLHSYGLPFESGQHTPEKILDATTVIKSPGIPDTAPLIWQCRAAGIPVISEIEFAGRYTRARTVCITGSNGKTTTTMLTYHILQKAGFNVGLAGNVGQSFARQVAEKEFDLYVIELSSFQLDGMYDFRADVAILLNITPDHLDRYDYRMENYVDSKFRIIRNQTAADTFIYNADDPIIVKELEKYTIPATRLPFTLGEPPSLGAGTTGNIMIINSKTKFSMSIFDFALQGKHNTYNTMAAGLAAAALNIRNETVRESLADFKGVEHRLESFLKVHGIEFINDSKATNVNSTWYALECVNKPIVWICGGEEHGNDYSELLDLVRRKVKAIVCLGRDNSRLINAFKGIVNDIVDTHDMNEAVRSAYYLASDNEAVLLSPACKSFDLFESYEDRGRQFKACVRQL